MKRFRQYLSIQKLIVSMSQQQAVEYRLDYFLRILRAIISVFVMVAVIAVFYSHTSEIMGWNQWEALVVYGFFQTISTFVFIFVGYGINNLPTNIIHGRLDNFLVKPLDAQFLTSTKLTFITNIFRTLFGIGVLIYALNHLSVSYSIASVCLSAIAFISAIAIYYALTFGTSALAFWTFSYEQSEIMYTLTSASRFPTDFYQQSLRWLLYILPLAFIATVPAEALLGKNYLFAAVSPLIAVISIVLVRKMWFAGLRKYESASS